MTRVALYARFSTQMQRETSIEDQVRLCKERADREHWSVVEIFPTWQSQERVCIAPDCRA